MTDPKSSGLLPPETEIGRLEFAVADLEGMTKFYRTVVGLSVLRERRGSRTLGAGGEPLLELVERPDLSDRPETAAGLYHAAFRVPHRAALGAALERVNTRHHLDGASDHGFSEALYLRDPEENGVEIYRDRPRQQWPRRDDGGVRMVPPGRLDLDALTEDSDGGSELPAGSDVGHIHLEVTNLDVARQFYIDDLGFELVSDYGAEATFVSAGGYHHHIAMNTWQSRTASAGGRGLSSFEIRVPDRATVTAVADRLAAAGAAADVEEGQVRTHDPDGIGVRIGGPD